MAIARPLIVLIILLTVSLAPPIRASGDTFTDDWTHGLSSWTVTGQVPVTQCAATCVLRLWPDNGANTALVHVFTQPGTGRYAVDFQFWSDVLDSDTDVNIGLEFDHGAELRFHPTEFVTVNDGLSLYASNANHIGFGFYKPHQWVNLHMIVDMNLHLAQAQLRLANGLTVPSLILPIDLTATQIKDVYIKSISWTSRTSGFSVGLFSAAPTAECFDPVGALDSLTRSPIQQLLNVNLSLDTVCDTLDWVIHFGDGVQDIGKTANATLQHAFNTTGAYLMQVNAQAPSSQHVLVNRTVNVFDPAAPATMPAAPGSLLAAPDTGIVGLSWTDAWDGGSPIKTHSIYRGTNGGPLSLLAANVDATQYADRAVANDAQYTYRVTAINTAGESAQSAPDTANMPAFVVKTVPAAPTGLTATFATATEAHLVWTDGANGGSTITSHAIYRGTSAGTETLLASAIAGTSFVDSNVAPSTTYYYRVTATNSLGESPLSNEATVTLPNGTPPAAPTGLRATHTATTVSLTWSDGSTGGSPITGHNVYRRTAAGQATLIASGIRGTSFVDNAVTKNVTYYYSMTAVNAIGESVPSSEANATPASTPIARSQQREGTFVLGVGGTDVTRPVRIGLDKVAQPGEVLTLSWSSPGVMGLRFVDSAGHELASCNATPGASSVACSNASGAQYAEVIGVGVYVPWTWVYNYTIWV